MSGDVDGDGQPDEVALAFDSTAPLGCQAFVVVRGALGSATLAMRDFDPNFGLPQPRLHALAEIDPRPGSEVLVDLVAGASTQFLGMFTMGGGSLERILVEGAAGPAGDLFAYGGSVGHLEASDCAGEASVVASVATPKGNRYRLVRRFFSFDGIVLRPEPSRTERHLVAADDIGSFPEYRTSPFGNC